MWSRLSRSLEPCLIPPALIVPWGHIVFVYHGVTKRSTHTYEYLFLPLLFASLPVCFAFPIVILHYLPLFSYFHPLPLPFIFFALSLTFIYRTYT
ncbi:hypothetical protein FIBSPDRAFT_34945 [Athelia psychrophila]|uniref:Uncharacterized protein n=1 Tax=Athelia psychrophila TaxID=1759441 RepID=A0A166FW52_9AGAM|nr:hypothetical protein FIBSPDRAFT_34945 [Fibularhizoctonia sp. CBS 109695]